ncbi:MAG TPA: D-alanine--D-alanine ligase [Pirellulaceae bacterium]|jgi:D-alanine-D-alanine ligase|nr:D-alanine--D-alanine ligase [Pirellulaceae bacterium]
MNIGLTYDLRSEYLAAGYSEIETAEFDREETINFLAQALEALGHRVDRIGHVRQLAARLVGGDRWDFVFNICEGLAGPSREAQVPCLLEAYGVPCVFSDALRMALCLEKGLTKTIAAAAGVPTSPFATVASCADADSISFDGPWFVKPIAEGTGKGCDPASIVRRREDLGPACERLLEQYRQPVLVERFLPGREVTVGILGTGDEAEVLGTLEIVLLDEAEPEVYSYENKERCETLVEYRPVSSREDGMVAEAERIALHAWKALGCRDGGRIDLRCDAEGRPLFLEVNPLAGLHPHHSDLPMIATSVGVSYVDLIGRIVASAAKRVPATASASPYRKLAGEAA